MITEKFHLDNTFKCLVGEQHCSGGNMVHIKQKDGEVEWDIGFYCLFISVPRS